MSESSVGKLTMSELIDECQQQAETIRQLEQENAEQAAHVERLNGKLKEIKESLYGQSLHVVGWHLNGDHEPMDGWFENNDWEPEPLSQQSLAHIQAEAVLAFADWYCADIDDVNVKVRAKVRANQLRQQADKG
jgi:hypothetical protein